METQEEFADNGVTYMAPAIVDPNKTRRLFRTLRPEAGVRLLGAVLCLFVRRGMRRGARFT